MGERTEAHTRTHNAHKWRIKKQTTVYTHNIEKLKTDQHNANKFVDKYCAMIFGCTFKHGGL